MMLTKLVTIIVLLKLYSFGKKLVDNGPKMFEENEVQILTDSDWDENLLNYKVYLVLYYVEGI